jgi:hypothetical protein
MREEVCVTNVVIYDKGGVPMFTLYKKDTFCEATSGFFNALIGYMNHQMRMGLIKFFNKGVRINMKRSAILIRQYPYFSVATYFIFKKKPSDSELLYFADLFAMMFFKEYENEIVQWNRKTDYFSNFDERLRAVSEKCSGLKFVKKQRSFVFLK